MKNSDINLVFNISLENRKLKKDLKNVTNIVVVIEMANTARYVDDTVITNFPITVKNNIITEEDEEVSLPSTLW